MIHVLNTKLLLIIIALLATIAGYLAYSHSLQVAQQKRELQREQEAKKFREEVKRLQKKHDATWTDGDKATRSFRLP